MSHPVDLTVLPDPDTHRTPGTGWRALDGLGALDLEFTQEDRPGLVNAVLSLCAPEGCGSVQIWAMSLAARIGALLEVWAATEQAGSEQSGRTPPGHLDLTFRCAAAGCGADLEVAVALDALQSMVSDATALPRSEVAPGLTLRRPTGTDQRNWRTTRPRDVQATILSDLIVEGAPDPALDMDALLADFDPLTCFSISTTCPECATHSTLPVDLEAHVLGLLGAAQARMFSAVDTLSQRYGWTDAQIMAMPARRRARYLAMARQEGAW